MFPVPPSKRAIIQVDVSYPISSVRMQGYNPMIGIYTAKDHIKFNKQCTRVGYSQLGNQNLHRPIRLDESDIRPPKCLKEGLDTIHCTGNITVQDYIPRNFFSFGFYCNDIAVSSLKGLFYNISIHEQSNDTNCISLPRKMKDACSGFYQHGLLPDLIGVDDVLTIARHWESFSAVLTILKGLCYQHMSEFGCYVVMPKCDPVSRQVMHPCREMCHDLRTACSKIVLNKNTVSLPLPFVSFVDKNITFDVADAGFDCDYLPFLKGDIPCFYKPVTCGSPPLVENAAMVNISVKYNNYSASDTVEYSCNEGFEMKGNGNISCLISGQWSTPPK